ncbi:MAG: protein phosphatase 2C domain-containing protein [archaeon]
MNFIKNAKNIIELLGTPKIIQREAVPHVIAFSEIGNREENQDNYYYDVDKGIYVVADGMGGYEGGKFCSKFAVDMIVNELNETYENIQNKELSLENIPSILEETISDTNYALHAMMENKKVSFLEDKGGTTIDILFIPKKTGYIAHVGDGMVALFNLEGERYVEKVTDEHHHYPEYAEKLSPTKKQVIGSILGLTSYLGKGSGLKIDMHKIRPKQNQVIGLFTDGVTKTVTQREMLDIISSNRLEDIEKTFIDRINNPVEIKKIVETMEKEDYDVSMNSMKGDNATGLLYGVIPK